MTRSKNLRTYNSLSAYSFFADGDSKRRGRCRIACSRFSVFSRAYISTFSRNKSVSLEKEKKKKTKNCGSFLTFRSGYLTPVNIQNSRQHSLIFSGIPFDKHNFPYQRMIIFVDSMYILRVLCEEIRFSFLIIVPT